MGDRYTSTLERFNSFLGKISRVANGQNSDVFASRYFAAFANLDFFEWCFPFGHDAVSARVANREGALIGQLCGVHEVAQLFFVHWGCYHHVWNHAHVGEVISTVVCCTVGTYQTTAV